LLASLKEIDPSLIPKQKKCVFLGYKSSTKVYIGLDINNREILVTGSIKFYENIFPYVMNDDSNTEKKN